MREPALNGVERRSAFLNRPKKSWPNQSVNLKQIVSKKYTSLSSRLKHSLVACLLAFLGSLSFISGAIAAQETKVIVNADVQKEAISSNALRAIFGMRLRTWPDGTPIRVFVLDDQSQIHVSFAKKILGIFPHQLRRAWDRLIYSGTGQAPIQVSSAKEMRAKVASTEGAIGYLPKEMINDSARVVEVE